jgi:hypothetical protein
MAHRVKARRAVPVKARTSIFNRVPGGQPAFHETTSSFQGCASNRGNRSTVSSPDRVRSKRSQRSNIRNCVRGETDFVPVAQPATASMAASASVPLNLPGVTARV